MRRGSVLRSVGAVVLPAVVLLSGCPDRCAPAPSPQDAAAPAAAGAPPGGGGGGGGGTAAPVPVGGQFTADFASAADVDRFDWQMMHGGVDPFPRDDQPRSWRGDHDGSCGAPTTLRDVHLHGAAGPGPVSVTGDNVWFCAPGDDPAKGHVMTSMSVVGYGHIDFSPRQVFNDVSRICWDQNQTEMGGRKWTQVSVIPLSLFQSNGGRLDYVTPDLQTDVAVGGVRLTGDAFMLSMLRASTQVRVGQNWEWNDFGGFQTDDKARRFRQCLVDQGGSVAIELEQPNSSHVRTVPGASLPDGPVRVIFQDVTYDSVKGDMPADQALQTNTWHWDNITIS